MTNVLQLLGSLRPTSKHQVSLRGTNKPALLSDKKKPPVFIFLDLRLWLKFYYFKNRNARTKHPSPHHLDALKLRWGHSGPGWSQRWLSPQICSHLPEEIRLPKSVDTWNTLFKASFTINLSCESTNFFYSVLSVLNYAPEFTLNPWN